MKEIEKLAPKKKNIRAQVIKETVQQLVADNRILTDKIGSTNIFWMFPAESALKVCCEYMLQGWPKIL